MEQPGQDLLPDGRGHWQIPPAGPDEQGVVDQGVRIRAAPLGHTVPCVGYVLDEADMPGPTSRGRAAMWL